jgi:hypothetical protein
MSLNTKIVLKIKFHVIKKNDVKIDGNFNNLLFCHNNYFFFIYKQIEIFLQLLITLMMNYIITEFHLLIRISFI